ncbi:hypothetical protein ASD48_11430 [Streptomyces sp. Root1310]|nr:hypothetical protein ASD48_11430 [Streptomyces sp. Root1310]
MSATAVSTPALSAPVLPSAVSATVGVTDPVEETDPVESVRSVPAVGEVVVAAAGEQRERLSAQASPPRAASPPRLPIAPALPELPPDVSGLTDLTRLPGSPALPDLSALPALPALSDFSALPVLPDLADYPGLPGLPVLPVLPSVPVWTLPVPAGEVPAQGSGAASSPDGNGPGPGLGPGDRKAAGAVPVTATGSAADAAADAETASYGPVSTGVGGSVDAGHRGASARTGHAPVHTPAHAPGPVRRGPAGDRDGVLAGGASVLDGSASRHGDTHAVTTRHRIPLRLPPGSAARSEAAGIRDTHRNIPVFPG